MKCDNCGHIFKSGNYCPECGKRVKRFVEENNEFEQVESTDAPRKYKVFGYVGFGLGIYSIALFWVPFNFIVAIIGIIFSNLGKNHEQVESKAKVGFILSLVAALLSLLITIAFISIVFTNPDYIYS
jgi:hypothetical protein